MFPTKINRLILWDVLKLFLVTTIGLTGLISVGLVGQQLISEGVGWLALIQLLPFICMIALQIAVPATLLFSVCSVFGRISADNEIVALKSVGVSPLKVIRPMMILGLLVSLPSVWINDLAVSWAQPGMEQVVLRSIKEIIYNRLRTRRSYENDKGFTVHVQEVQGDWLIRPTIFCFDEVTGKPTTITAERAQIFKDPDQDQLILEMVNSKGETSHSNATRFNIPGSERFNMSLNRASQKGGDSARPSQFAMKQIPDEVDKQLKHNDRITETMAIQISMGLGMGRYNQLSEASLQSMAVQIEENRKRLTRLELEPYRRWSFGFACFFFVWIGVPFAILNKSADYAWTFGMCFIPIMLMYFPLFGLALDRAKDGAWPASTLWIGNAFLFFVGTWLRHRVVNS
ncbi:MAG: LptF/LptG family permease [Pirellula sp.]|jgi:lipopolysaccharide export system permease protein|nr:LptF/LptG family permease [Planctomycetota bacterium]